MKEKMANLGRYSRGSRLPVVGYTFGRFEMPQSGIVGQKSEKQRCESELCARK